MSLSEMPEIGKDPDTPRANAELVFRHDERYGLEGFVYFGFAQGLEREASGLLMALKRLRDAVERHRTEEVMWALNGANTTIAKAESK